MLCCYYPNYSRQFGHLIPLAGARCIRRPNFIAHNCGIRCIIVVGG